MNIITKTGGLVLLCLALSGCLGTMAVVGTGVASALTAGCDSASDSTTANQGVVNRLCGSMFN